MEALTEVVIEILFEPFRLLLHWIVRCLGGSNPRFSLIWKYACWFFVLLSVVIFLGAIAGIITQVIGPFTMFWMFVGSFVILMGAMGASEVVSKPQDLKAPLKAAENEADTLPRK